MVLLEVLLSTVQSCGYRILFYSCTGHIGFHLNSVHPRGTLELGFHRALLKTKASMHAVVNEDEEVDMHIHT